MDCGERVQVSETSDAVASALGQMRSCHQFCRRRIFNLFNNDFSDPVLTQHQASEHEYVHSKMHAGMIKLRFPSNSTHLKVLDWFGESRRNNRFQRTGSGHYVRCNCIVCKVFGGKHGQVSGDHRRGLREQPRWLNLLDCAFARPS